MNNFARNADRKNQKVAASTTERNKDTTEGEGVEIEWKDTASTSSSSLQTPTSPDSMLAQQLQEEERKLRANDANQRAFMDNQAFKGNIVCRVVILLISIILLSTGILAVVPLIASAVGVENEDLPPFLTDLWWGGANSTDGEFLQWRGHTDGSGGLDLVVANALTSPDTNKWTPILEEAVRQWDEGTPDGVDLTLRRLTSPPQSGDDCPPITGQLKVCNGEYGNTGWYGRNNAYTNAAGVITASVTLMNDSYFRNSNQNAKMRYIMCHELGHGLGLPHRDESFLNRDLGTCMDYPRNAANNMQPDQTDYQNLVNMYGEIGGVGSSQAGQLAAGGGNTNIIRDNKNKNKNKNDRRRRRRQRRFLRKGNHQVQRRRELFFFDNSVEGWKHLHSSEYSEIYERELSDGTKVISFFLLAF